jgi:hypothetical protein
MKTDLTIDKKNRKIYIKYYSGFYPLGAFVAWPDNKLNTNKSGEMPYRRTKAGGYVSLPNSNSKK